MLACLQALFERLALRRPNESFTCKRVERHPCAYAVPVRESHDRLKVWSGSTSSAHPCAHTDAWDQELARERVRVPFALSRRSAIHIGHFVDGGCVAEEVVAVLVRECEPSSYRPVVAVDERQSLTPLLTVRASDTVRERQHSDGDPGARVLVDQSEDIADRIGVAETERAPSVMRLLRR